MPLGVSPPGAPLGVDCGYQKSVMAQLRCFWLGRSKDPLPSTATTYRRDLQRPVNVCAVTRRRFPVGASSHPATAPAGSNRSSHGGEIAAEGEPAGLVERRQTIEKQAAEQPREHAHGQEEAGLAGDPARAARRQAVAGNDDVHVRMVGQSRAPGVQNGGEADARAKMLGVGRDRDQRLGRGCVSAPKRDPPRIERKQLKWHIKMLHWWGPDRRRSGPPSTRVFTVTSKC